MSERQPEKIIRSVPLLAGARRVRKLAGGPTSDSWLLQHDGGRFVLRADKPLAGRLRLDRAAELEVLQAAALAGFGPEVFWADPEKGLLLTHYIPGKHWNKSDVCRPPNIQRLAGRIKEVHAAEISAPRMDIEATAARYAELTNTAQSRELFAKVRGAVSAVRDDLTEYGFCHNDLGYRNIVDTGTIMFVDWEYAATGVIWFDIAGAIIQNRYSTSKSRHFAELCCGPHEEIERRLRLFSRLYDLVSALWYMVVCASGSNMANQSQLHRVMQRLEAAVD